MTQGVLLTEIINFLKDDIIRLHGNFDNLLIKYLQAPSMVDEYTLDWINPAKIEKQFVAENSKARAIISNNEVIYTKTLIDSKKVLIVTNDPKLSITKIGHRFFSDKIQPLISHTAIINENAKIGVNAFIGENTVIGKCKIGNNVKIHHNVVIYDNVEIGNNVTVYSGAVIGPDGFGFQKDTNGDLIRFPQLGKVIIGDNVEIGSNTCIDRGALGNTEIGPGTKINNLCHIAHNVSIGRNVIITAHVNVSGSSIIEDNVWIAPNVSLKGHIIIGKNAFIGVGAVITKNVPVGETWVGNPAKKLK